MSCHTPLLFPYDVLLLDDDLPFTNEDSFIIWRREWTMKHQPSYQPSKKPRSIPNIKKDDHSTS